MKKHHVLIQFLIIIFVAQFATACFLDDDDNNNVDASEIVKQYQPGDTATLTFESGDEVYRVVPFYTAQTESEAGFTIGVSGASTDIVSERLKAAKTFKEHKPSWISETRYNQILARQKWSEIQHQRAIEVAEQGIFERDIFKKARLNAKLSSECGEDELYRDGDCNNEFSLEFMDFDGEVTDISVTVKAKGTNAAVVVDVDDVDDVSQDDINEILNMFDNVVYPRDQFFYGGSVFDDIDYVDRDQDGMHMIVMSHLVNDTGAVGLFNPADFGTDLNVADILYVVVPDDDNPVSSILGTLAHEYSHMLMYGIKRAKFKAMETIWLDESMAHLMEDLSGFGVDNLDISNAYLSSPGQIGWAFSFDENETETRGMGFLMMRYLFEQKGGATYSETDGSDLTDKGGANFISTLVQTDNTGFAALEDALGGFGSFKDNLFGWLAAVAVNGTDMNAGDTYDYDDVVTDKITGQERGVCTHCTRSSSYGYEVEFNGMASAALVSGDNNGIVKASGASSFELTADGNQSLSLDADDEDIHFGVFRIK